MYYKLTDTPRERFLLSGYAFPVELPISGSHSLKADHVSRLVPIKKIRTLLKCTLLTSFVGKVYPTSKVFKRR